MGHVVPWQIAGRKYPESTKVRIYARDPYNFSHRSFTSGTNPELVLPPMGPHAAGALAPTLFPTVIGETVVTSTKNTAQEYGDNRGGFNSK